MVSDISGGQLVAVIAGLMTGLLLAALDGTVVSTVMPTVIAELGGWQLYAWTFSAFILAQTAALPLFGRLSDLYGQRRLFLAGLAIFMAGSALCGLSRTMEQLIAFRALQGLGAGAIFPIALAAVGILFPPERRAKIQGVFSAVFGISSVVGPSVGAFIVEHWSWRWAFYVNLPLGLLSAALVWLYLPHPPGSDRKHHVDYAGAATLAIGVSCLLFAFLDTGADYFWSSPRSLALLAAAAVSLVAFALVERRSPEPILPLGLFGNGTIAAASAANLFHGVAMFSAISFIPLFVQGAIGGSAAQARNVLMPMMISVVAGATLAGRLYFRAGPRALSCTALLVAALGFWRLQQMTSATTPATAAINMSVTGFGVGVAMVTLILSIQFSVSRREMGIATSLAQFFRNLGGVIGVSLLGAWQARVFAHQIQALQATPVFDRLGDTARNLQDPKKLFQILINPPAASPVPPEAMARLRDAVADSLHPVFVVGTVVCLAAAVAVLFLRPRTRPAD